MPKCPKCDHTFELPPDEVYGNCPACGQVMYVEKFLTESERTSRKTYHMKENKLWANYPTLRVLKIVFQIVGILALIGSFIVGVQTSSFTVFLSAAMGGLTFLAVPEIILILVRIESHLRELKDK